MRFCYFLIAGILLLSSCISNRKVLYLQKDDLNKKNLPLDSVVRTYPMDTFNYRIQPNDAIYVKFSSVTDEKFDFLSSQQGNNSVAIQGGLTINSELVDEEGMINFPVIGKVKVTGLTIFEIQDKLQGYANQYLESAIVKVRLVNFRYTVLGEVNHEATITTFNNRVTLPEAIGLAGGLGELADRSTVKIIRQINGTSQIFYVNLLDENIISSPNYYIFQNDIVIVPPLRQRPFRKYFGQNVSLFLSSVSVILLIINLSK